MNCFTAQMLALVALGCGNEQRVQSLIETDATTADATISLTGNVFEFSTLLGGRNLEGVHVCLDGSEKCTETDSAGQFVLSGLEPEAELILTYEKSGYTRTLHPLVTPRWSSTLGPITFAPTQTTQLAIAAFNQRLSAIGLDDIDASTEGLPSVSFSSVTGNLGNRNVDPNLRVRLDPDSGRPAMFVSATSGAIDLAVAEGDMASFGIFFNVEPREDYELVYEHSNGPCVYYPSGLGGWPSRSGRSNATRVPVRDGYTTYVSYQFCPFSAASSP